METLFIVGACALGGYYMNKNGKQSRQTTKDIEIPPKMETYKVKDIDSRLKNLADVKYKNKMEQLYPGITGNSNIVANDAEEDRFTSLLDAYSGKYSDTSPAEILSSMTPYSSVSDKDVSNNMVMLSNVSSREQFDYLTAANSSDDNMYSMDPMTTDQVVPDSSVLNSSLFDHQPEFLKQTYDNTVELSSLTGLPLDKTHANMKPFYSGSLKVNTNDQNSQVLLEKFTGRPSSDNYGTYMTQKQESQPLFSPTPQNPIKASFDQVTNRYDMAKTAVGTSNAFVSPVKSFRDKPIEINDVRVNPPSGILNANRSVMSPYMSYTSDVVPGQKGSTRALISKMQANQYDLGDSSYDARNPNSVISKPTTFSTPNIRDDVVASTSVFVNDGSSTNFSLPTTSSRDVEGIVNSMNIPDADNVVDNKTLINFGGAITTGDKLKSTYIMNSKSNATENSYIVAPSMVKFGKRMGLTDDITPTLRDIRAENISQPSNPSALKFNDGAWKGDYVADYTSKDMNSENNYVGQSFKKLDSAYVKTNFEDWVTSKEMAATYPSETINYKSMIPKSISYESVFENSIDDDVKPVWIGAPTIEVKKTMTDMKTPLCTSKDGFVELETDWVAPPEVRVKRSFDVRFDDTFNKIDAGGHLNPVSAARFGSDGKRLQQAQAFDMSMETNGRMNVGISREFKDIALPNAYMDDDDVISNSSTTTSRVIPTRDMRDAFDMTGLPTKNKNTETINSRIGSVTMVPNDLHPSMSL